MVCLWGLQAMSMFRRERAQKCEIRLKIGATIGSLQGGQRDLEPIAQNSLLRLLWRWVLLRLLWLRVAGSFGVFGSGSTSKIR